MHALVAAFLNLIAQLTDVPQLAPYVYTVGFSLEVSVFGLKIRFQANIFQ